jgi:putative ABC transport system ATP-binding protein
MDTIAALEIADPVQVRSLLKVYPSPGGDVTVLDRVSASVRAGQVVALTGVSGSGKSTLLNVLAGIDAFDDGRVHVCGVDLATLRPAQRSSFRAHHIGFVFQFFNILPMLTALENVAAALEPLQVKRKERDARAAAMLSRVGLGSRARSYPGQLSGGEQQRVSIARAMVKNPPLLLADEPTGALDHDNAVQVMDYIRELQRDSGTTVIVATHDPLVLSYADVQWRLAGGTVEVTQL